MFTPFCNFSPLNQLREQQCFSLRQGCSSLRQQQRSLSSPYRRSRFNSFATAPTLLLIAF